MSIENDKQDQANIDARPAEAKQPYKRPALVNLGTLRDLTTTLGGVVHPDGGKKQFTGRGGLNGLGTRGRG